MIYLIEAYLVYQDDEPEAVDQPSYTKSKSKVAEEVARLKLCVMAELIKSGSFYAGRLKDITCTEEGGSLLFMFKEWKHSPPHKVATVSVREIKELT